MVLSRYTTNGLGGPFPPGLPLTSLRDVLDIACGPGEWALDVAQTFPHMDVTGVDISTRMIDVAQTLATQSQTSNAHFRVMDATSLLDFADASFDLINSRLIFGFMPRDLWPRYLQECRRLLRPGGLLILTESEMLVTSSPALEQMSSFFMQGLYLAGQGFSSLGIGSGITPLLPRFLHEADFELLQQRGCSLNYSAGTSIHQNSYENARIAFQLMEPFLVKWKVAAPEQIQAVYQQMLTEMLSPGFCALHYYYQVIGRKPLDE